MFKNYLAKSLALACSLIFFGSLPAMDGNIRAEGLVTLKKIVLSAMMLEKKYPNKNETHIYLNHNAWVCDETLFVLEKLYPKLKILEICDCEGVDTSKIVDFAERNRCDVCYGRRSAADTWFIAQAYGGHPTIVHALRFLGTPDENGSQNPLDESIEYVRWVISTDGWIFS